MLDLNNLHYFMSTRPEVAGAVAVGALALSALVIGPLLYVLLPVAKLVFTLGAAG